MPLCMKLGAVVIGGFEPFFYGIMRSVFSIMAKRSVCSTEEVIPYHIPNSVVGFGFGVSIGVGLEPSLNFHQRCRVLVTYKSYTVYCSQYVIL
jgi:hypothetical protein